MSEYNGMLHNGLVFYGVIIQQRTLLYFCCLTRRKDAVRYCVTILIHLKKQKECLKRLLK